MPDKVSKTRRVDRKKVVIPASQLPETYNELLEEYATLVQSEPANPYEFSMAKRIRDFFNVRGQFEYVASPQINNFIKTPDTLAQELPAAKDMLGKLDRFDDQAIRSFAKLNEINLARLRRRSIRNQIGPGIVFTGSLIGLLLDLQDILAVSIKDSLAWFARFNLSLFLQWIIILIVILAVVIARVNWMFTTPRIGLVNAFGDILHIMMSYRNLKE